MIYTIFKLNSTYSTNDKSIIEQCGLFLNLKKISDYSKDNNISYNGAKKFRDVKKIFNINFIIDNN